MMDCDSEGFDLNAGGVVIDEPPRRLMTASWPGCFGPEARAESGIRVWEEDVVGYGAALEQVGGGRGWRRWRGDVRGNARARTVGAWGGARRTRWWG